MQIIYKKALYKVFSSSCIDR